MISSDSTLVDVLEQRAASGGDRVALRFLADGERATHTSSFRDLHEAACAVAARLQQVAAPGDRALLLYPSGLEYVKAFLGCLYAGIIAVPAYPPESSAPQHAKRLLSIVRDAQPSLVLTQSELIAPLEAARAIFPDLASVALLATDRVDAAEAGSWRRPALAGETIAFLQYTSGSTATPKGVIVDHRNLLANEAVIARAFQMTEADVVVSWLPLFHDMGLIGGLLQPIFTGGSLVLFGPQHFMERPLRWLEAIARFGGTVSGAPDFAYRLCAERAKGRAPTDLDLSSWRVAFCGAEPIRAASLRRFADCFAPAGFRANALFPCYGLAEATLFVSGATPGAGFETAAVDEAALRDHRVHFSSEGRELVCCGEADQDYELLVVDPETDSVAAPGQVGELYVSGASVARGYWQNSTATAETFVERAGRTYLRTGDMGFVDGRRLFVTGRRKDMLIVRGQNLYPQDIEATIEEQLEFVRRGRVAAFSLDGADREAIGVAVEVSRRLQKLLEPERFCREIAEVVARAHGETPALVLLLSPGALPITSSGKLQRSLCARRFRSGQLDAFAVYERGVLVHGTSALTAAEVVP